MGAKKCMILLAVAVLVGLFINDYAAAQEQNLLRNPSFEDARSGRPIAWRSQTWNGEGTFEYAAVGRTGQASVKMNSTTGADISYGQTVTVEPFSRYRLSGWIKTENVAAGTGEGALLNIHDMQGTKTPAVTGTKDWTQVACEFVTTNNSLQIHCLFGGWGSSTGTAWYDDVRLEKIGTALPETKTAEARVAIDADATGEPISKYIYGQFIEHLGRCIYGGIWAELLEDRKFFHPPGSPDSPWRKFGTEIGWSLLHDPERFYTGNASVKISMTTRAPDELQGIQQAALGLRADRDYRGHVILAGRGTVKVRLQWGSRPSQSDTATFRLNQQNFGRYPFHFRPGTTTTNGILTLGLESSGAIWIGAASLMPADHVDGLRPDTLKLLHELDSPIYRWPGGNFVSGYDWRDGIGPKDRRPPRKNPAWQGIEPNDFGIDEFIALCRRLGTEPLVVVNTGLGSPELAAALVQYCNGGPQTIWGRRRAAHGQPQPYGVKWWGVGNEMYGDWQLGHVDPDRYQVRHREFVRAMRTVDPDIRIIAVGATGPWSEGMLTHCAQEMDLLSEHFYCGEQADLEAHVAAIPNAIRDKASAHR
ncbi:MAG: hypothetical protein IH624_02785, partial [Phycisphaerae bacterium]|nr:hypothetical protein [Phycisphaerae bacterium]